ncbi:hypothetical protein TIFTF001_010742 [Ficus carica]|uniref:GDSL esterase/lipase n=1 Tax=Ficus carica TaxID=3494 RepID=A0AA88D3M7_FICCA|nr:hypothetical protein TIFTF001_010742 [Ficus carica]
MEPLYLGLSVLISLLMSATLVRSETGVSKSSCHFPAIFNFGDSNSDTGGLSAAFGQAPYPNGETYFHTPSGRFSDGRLIVDFIAESLGLPYLSSYLDSLGSNFSHGANFATAGSTIRPQNTTISQSGYSPISLDVQYVQFSDFRKRSQNIRKQGGLFGTSLPKEEDFSQALYTFDIGQNDLTAGPVGCLPYVLDRYLITAAQIDKHGCATPFNDVAQHFNQRLKSALAQLRKELPLAAITYVDVYSVKYTLISQAKKYGFENPLVACCGHGGKYNYNRYNKCGSKKTINGEEIVIAKSCSNPMVKINWDGVHFTEAANKRIFNQIANGFFSDPPIPLRMSCHATGL